MRDSTDVLEMRKLALLAIRLILIVHSPAFGWLKYRRKESGQEQRYTRIFLGVPQDILMMPAGQGGPNSVEASVPQRQRGDVWSSQGLVDNS